MLKFALFAERLFRLCKLLRGVTLCESGWVCFSGFRVSLTFIQLRCLNLKPKSDFLFLKSPQCCRSCSTALWRSERVCVSLSVCLHRCGCQRDNKMLKKEVILFPHGRALTWWQHVNSRGTWSNLFSDWLMQIHSI